MFKRVLAVVDGSTQGMCALPYAAWLAAAAQGEVVLIRVVASDEQRDDVEWELATTVSRLRRRGLTARAFVCASDNRRTAARIVASQQEHQADLIVLGTQGGRGPDRALWGSTADDVLRRAPVPVLLVPKRSPQAWPRRRPLRVLVPLDSGADAATPLLLLQRLAAVTPIHLVLARAADASDHLVPDEGPPFWTTPPTVGKDLQHCLDAVATGMPVNWLVTIIRRSGNSGAPYVAEIAREEHSDLIVMATDGRRDPVRLLVGGTARGVLHRLPVPLLLTRPAAARFKCGARKG